MAVCCLCLSMDRNTSSIFSRQSYRLVTGCTENERTRVCWECRARLRHVDQFREQAQRATLQLSLTATSQLKSLSQLSYGTKIGYDAVFCWSSEVVPDVSVEIDQIEEKCEYNSSPKFDTEITFAEDWDVDFKTSSPEIERKEKKKKRTEDCYQHGNVKRKSRDSKGCENVTPLAKTKNAKTRIKTKRLSVKRIAPEDTDYDTFEKLDQDLVSVCARVCESRAEAAARRRGRLRRAPAARHACVDCALSHRTQRHLAAHRSALHAQDGLACGVCDCRAVDEATLLRHAASHVALKCVRCRFRTRNRDSMRRHARLHDRDSTTVYPCDLCDKKYKYKQALVYHRARHVSNKRFECDHCGRAYSTRVQIFRHLKQHRKTFLCDVCGKGFPNKTTLKYHTLAHLGADRREHRCDVCNKRYTSRYKLEAHASFHAAGRPYACSHCDRGFRERAQVTAHVRKMHPESAEPKQERKKITHRTKSAFVNTPFVGPEEAKDIERRREEKKDKLFSCNICGKTFKDRYGLKLHVTAHSGERPYKCDECGMTFKYPQGVWTHKKVHTGAKDFECTICGRKFAQKGNLSYHAKIHSNEKPHQCAACGNKFRSKSNLRKHCLVVHNNVYLCE